MSSSIFDEPDSAGEEVAVSEGEVEVVVDEELQEVAVSKKSSSPVASSSGKGFQAVAFGTKIDRFPIPKIKFEEGKKEHLVPFLEDGIIAVRYHFFKDVGYIYCTGGTCCRVDGVPPVRYVIPVIRLDTEGDKVTLPLSGKVHVWVLGEDNYEFVTELHTDNDGVFGKIIKIICTDKVYQKIQMSLISRTDKSMLSLIRSCSVYWEKHQGTIKGMLAKSLKDSEIADALGVMEGSNVDESTFFTG